MLPYAFSNRRAIARKLGGWDARMPLDIMSLQASQLPGLKHFTFAVIYVHLWLIEYMFYADLACFRLPITIVSKTSNKLTIIKNIAIEAAMGILV